MEILITDSKMISEIQKEFSAEFPFLKLEFFDTEPSENKALPKSKMFLNDKQLGEIRKVHNSGNFAINKSNTVSNIEQGLWKNFGLSAQVFRKSGNLWIETSLTDNWTLEQQNREGFEMSTHAKNSSEELDGNDPSDRDTWQ